MEIRDTQYLTWRDPLAWMERMKGKRWETLLEKEKHHYHELTSQVKKETRLMEKEITYAQQYLKIPAFTIGCGTINIDLSPGSRFNWKWSWQKTGKPAYDIDVQGNIVWYVTSNDDEDYSKLICEDSHGKHIWSKNKVSNEVAIIGELCYYIKVVDYFRTVEVCVCNAHTGTHEKILYKEMDEKRELIFTKGANRTLYVTSDEPLNSTLYKINGTNIEQLHKRSTFQMPLGESIYGDDCVLIRKSSYDKWEAKGNPIANWIFPDEEPDWVNIYSGLIITMFEGSQTIWYCSHKKPKIILKIKVGYIEPNMWSIWEGTLVQSFIIKTPVEPPYIIHIIHNKIHRDTAIQMKHPIRFDPLEVHRYHSVSKDGTSVPYIVIKQKGKPKAQLVYVYGAYGSSTPIGWPYQNWYPLLKRGWALVFALVRGGGDIDAAWAEMARRNNRHKSIEDFESIIRSSQKLLKIGPEHTVIYGRSAGGLPVGAIVSKFPNGQLVGAAFTEVPFVDILRTSSNPDLPLTVGEFDEFGNPMDNILHFKELLSVSPVNTLSENGAPGVFVMSHVGLLDKQVFAYESFKWIHRLRGNSIEPDKKYVTFEKKEAHQYRPQKMPRFRATDLAILDAWVDGKLSMR